MSARVFVLCCGDDVYGYRRNLDLVGGVCRCVSLIQYKKNFHVTITNTSLQMKEEGGMRNEDIGFYFSLYTRDSARMSVSVNQLSYVT